MKLLWITLLSLGLSACSHLLPRANDSASSFESYDAARQAVEGHIPLGSTIEALRTLKLDPAQHPNTRILSHSELARRFLPSNLLERKDLDPGIIACLEARQSCQAWEINESRIKRERTGNFLLDFVNFKRRTVTTGWRFQALVLLVNDQVVYRSWGGQPNINQVQQTNNPLGPFQDVGPSTVTNQ
jgi:hypothetical protein